MGGQNAEVIFPAILRFISRLPLQAIRDTSLPGWRTKVVQAIRAFSVRPSGQTALFVALFALASPSSAIAQTTPLRPSIRPGLATTTTSSPGLGDSQVTPLPADLFTTPQRHQGPATNFVLGAEATQLRSFDVGSFLDQSLDADGVTAHKRTTIANDVRIRGSRAGQNIGAGSLWNPGRPDLDTALNKIFAYNIDHLTLVKGPYSVRYGPGFNFVDMQFLRAPIGDGPNWGGVTSFDYETNGAIFYGRQHVWGGDQDWGVRVNYGHGTGNDFEDGSDFQIPSSFKSRDLFVSLGRRLDEDRHLEFSYIRLDQTDVEFPGLVYDIDYLVTDGLELEYDDVSGRWADRFHAEYWYNRTRFEGSTLREGKNRQIPQLRTTFYSVDGISGYAITDVDGSSSGARWSWTWSRCCGELSVGTDVAYIDQTLNDIEPELPSFANNFPVPHSNAWDVGWFSEYTRRIAPDWSMTAGVRADIMQTDSSEYTEGVPIPQSFLKDAPLEQEFGMWAAYLTSKRDLNSHWALHGGFGFSQRPPSLTELYADQSFIGTLQQGLTFVDGDPLLKAEKLRQIDVSLNWNYQRFRGGVNGFYSWIEDYITYDLTAPADPEFGLTNGVAFVNTDLATLSGFELHGEYDVAPVLTTFGRLSFVEGRDHSREQGARQLGGFLRSGVFGEHEPLPGIPPLEAIVGVSLRDPCQLWGVDFIARIVDNQDRVATSLQEIETPGFTTLDLRSHWQLTDRLTFYAGVENLTNKFYREHLDYLSGLGLARRGVSGYFGTDFRF